jgi:FMN phosphatase YigB (HAD superfamily)
MGPFALQSNSFGLEPYNVYRELGVLELCDVVLLSELEGIREPAPAIYRLTCERLGLPPPSASSSTIAMSKQVNELFGL